MFGLHAFVALCPLSHLTTHSVKSCCPQVKWTWSGGPTHDVSKTPSRECGNYTLVSDPPSSDGSFSKTFDTKGTFWYACSVGSHCEDGLRITVYVK